VSQNDNVPISVERSSRHSCHHFHFVFGRSKVRFSSLRPATCEFRFFLITTFTHRSRVSSGSIVSDYGRSGFDPRQGQRIFPLASLSRPALGPTQPPVQWVPGVLSPGVKLGRGATLTTHPHLVPRSWMSRSYTPLPSSASMPCNETALLYFYTYKYALRVHF
jgi:hypothetical protein